MTMDWRKYGLVFLISAAIFAVALALSDRLYRARLSEVESIERRITLNLLSSEVQFALLADSSSCATETSPILAGELNSLASRLEFMERERGSEDPEVEALKSQYSLLQIKDILLVRELTKRCGTDGHTIVYFYSNESGVCEDCERQGYVLSALRRDHPDLKVYAFDSDLDLGAVQTLKQIYGVHDALPALIIDRKTVFGFHTQEQIETLGNLERATSTQETALELE
jgi:hypothetical protein